MRKTCGSNFEEQRVEQRSERPRPTRSWSLVPNSGTRKAHGVSPRAWLVYLMVGVLAILVYYLLPYPAIKNLIYYPVVGVSAVTTIVVGVRVHRPARSLVWYLFAIGLLMFVVGDFMFSYYEDILGTEPFPSLADASFLGAYLPITAGLLILIQGRIPGGDRASLLDATIVTTGLGMLSWVFLMAPYAKDPSLSLFERSVLVAYPLADVLLLAVLVRFMIAPGARTLAYYLFGLSLVMLVIADATYGAAELAGTFVVGGLISVSYLLSYVLWGAAALHPTVSALALPAPDRGAKPSRARLLLLVGASLMAPAVLAIQAMRGESIDVPVIVGGSVVLFSLVMLRMEGLLRALAIALAKHRQAEKELREAEARYRTLVEQIPAGIYARDCDTDVLTYANPRMATMLGYSPNGSSSTFEDWMSEIHPDDRERVETETIRSNETGEPFRTEYRQLARDGRVVWVRDEAVVVRDGAGHPRFRQGVKLDITERRQAEEALRVSETRLRTMITQSPLAIHIFASDGRSLLTNGTWEDLWNPGEVEETPESSNVLKDEQLLAMGLVPYIEESITSGVAATTPPLLHDPACSGREGDPRWLRAFTYPVQDEDGSILEAALILEDITERKRAEEALTRSESSLSAAQRIAHVGNWEYSIKDDEAHWSNEMYRIFGFAPQEFTPTYRTFLELVHPEEKALVQRTARQALCGRPVSDIDYRVVRPDGEIRSVHAQLEVFHDASKKPFRMVGTVHDVTERRALEEKLKYQAFHDSLTGLPNRALFLDRLRHALGSVTRQQKSFAVLFLDLDNFKVINDSLGHDIGDRLLVAVGRRLSTRSRPGDTAARLGGDEFTILFEAVDDAGEVVDIAERIAEDLRAPFVVNGHELFITASIGIVTSNSAHNHPEDLLRDADLAMYRAKENGKARCEVFDLILNARMLKRLELGNDLRRAVERGEFVLHYQPKILLKTGKIIGTEALLRWEHPERGLIYPDEFISIAEETGLIVPIGQWVLEEACRQTREWHARRPLDDPPLTMNVNLSAKQFQHPSLVEDIDRTLRRNGLNPSSLNLEITESVVMDEAESTVARLRDLKDLGVELAIDDFGTGHSSLSYLKRFPVSYLKIDRSFIDGLGVYPNDTVLVSGMVSLAQALGLKVVAEGVETADQFARLRELGCDLAQGYHFARPLTSRAFDQMLADADGGEFSH